MYGTVEFPVADAPLEVGTLIIDSVDAVQMFQVPRGRAKMERSDGDTLLNKMMPLRRARLVNWGDSP